MALAGGFWHRLRQMPSDSEPMASEAILADSIDRLTGTFQRLEGLLEELRQDFGWLVPAGRPATGRYHLALHRMALDPCGSGWAEKLLVTSDRIDFDLTASPLESDALDRPLMCCGRHSTGSAGGNSLRCSHSWRIFAKTCTPSWASTHSPSPKWLSPPARAAPSLHQSQVAPNHAPTHLRPASCSDSTGGTTIHLGGSVSQG
jgi:hypothetical protein